MYILGLDVGSTTCKYVLTDLKGNIIDKAYERHNTRQAEKVYEFLLRLEKKGFTPGRDRVFITGSGAGIIGTLIGARFIQEVVAVAEAVERLNPEVRFVSEIGGEDMKSIFFKGEGKNKTRQVFMQSVCAGGTGAFIEKCARKMGLSLERLSEMGYKGLQIHKVSSKCGIFAEADINTLLKAGVPVEEIVASLFEAVVIQNLSVLIKGNVPKPEVLLLGGPNLFFKGLREAWTYHLSKLWKERGIKLPEGKSPEELIKVPSNALFYAAMGCSIAASFQSGGVYTGKEKLKWWIEEGQYKQKEAEGVKGLWKTKDELEEFIKKYKSQIASLPIWSTEEVKKVVIGCDFGSTTAKAVCLSEKGEIIFSTYALSKGNPIEDAKRIFREIKERTKKAEILALGITGYGKDLLKDILGADTAIVETVAHATAGLHFFPDADCICDVGGVDVKIIIIKNGAVVDFRLNSQCSSGNGAFLQGVAERFGIALEDIANRAFSATMMPKLTMGCGVFLQSDIVNQQRKGWNAEEILAALCYILPYNVWIYAGNITNFNDIGRKFILQGGTHRNLAVVKSQVDFLKSKVPDAEIVIHPYPGEAGAIGAALVALEHTKTTGATRFRGFDVIENLEYRTTTSEETTCRWCSVECRRTFVDVKLPDGKGRPWSKVPLPEGWVRIIVGASCPKGFVEDKEELKRIRSEMEKIKGKFPNIAQIVQKTAFITKTDIKALC